MPDLEDLPSDNDNSNNEPESKNTNYEGCQTGRCCFQYTWQGRTFRHSKKCQNQCQMIHFTFA